jgi:hypothetical protein
MLEPERFPNGSASKQYAERARTPQPAIAAIPCTSESKDVEVPGLVLERDFLSPDEEIEILAHLDSLQWEAQMSRRVQHFGFTFDYVSRRLLRCTRERERQRARARERESEREMVIMRTPPWRHGGVNATPWRAQVRIRPVVVCLCACMRACVRVVSTR